MLFSWRNVLSEVLSPSLTNFAYQIIWDKSETWDLHQTPWYRLGKIKIKAKKWDESQILRAYFCFYYQLQNELNFKKWVLSVRERVGARERKRGRVCVCVCMCVFNASDIGPCKTSPEEK